LNGDSATFSRRFPRLALPLILNPRNKLLIGFLWYVIACTLYLITNHFHLSEPRLLPMSALDQATPFLPHTVWIYMSEYFFFMAMYATCKDVVNTNKYIYSFLFLQFAQAFIFLTWPTTNPRDLFPLPSTLDHITAYAFNGLRSTDSPANCCPSLHVSSVYLSTFIFLNDQPKKFPFFFLWGTAIAISTLTTKQHYLVDVVTGFGMAALFYWFFHRVVQYYPLPQKSAAGANR
jgi:membrane-associated phospholipid phosphatase